MTFSPNANLSIAIEHQPTRIEKLYGFFLSFFWAGFRKSDYSFFWRTEVNKHGVLVSKKWGESVLIPWSKIKCLDLTGLEMLNLSLMPSIKKMVPELSKSNKDRFFSIMSDDLELLRRICPHPSRKIDRPASNVLSLTAISAASALKIKDDLEDLAKSQGIKLDTIVLPD